MVKFSTPTKSLVHPKRPIVNDKPASFDIKSAKAFFDHKMSKVKYANFMHSLVPCRLLFGIGDRVKWSFKGRCYEGHVTKVCDF